jgi:hypothetical protein
MCIVFCMGDFALSTGVTTMTAFPDLDSHKWNAYFNAAQAMADHGGGFAGAIAEAYYKADKGNKAKLESAFADLFFSFMSDYDKAWFGK